MADVVFLEDHNFEKIQKALLAIGYEVTKLSFSTPDFMTPIEKQDESPTHE